MGPRLRYKGAAEIEPVVPRLSFGQGLVLLPLARSEEVHDMLPSGMQNLRDQASMAAPPKGLRAHEAGSRFRHRCGERCLPPVGAHAGGIAAEGSDAKATEVTLARLAVEPAAKLDRVPVGDSALLERRLESRLVELRVVTRAGKASHVNKRARASLADN